MFITDLPVEISTIVFSQLKERDLYECLQVNTTSYARLAPTLYHTVTLSRNHHAFLKSLTQPRPDQHRLGHHLHHLHLKPHYTGPILTLSEFQLLLTYLPKLQSIHLEIERHSDLARIYLTYLQRTPNQLRQIQIPRYLIHHKKVFTAHYLANHQARHTIEHLTLLDLSVRKLNLPLDQTLQLLKEFPRLRRLEIANREIKRGARDGLHLASILQATRLEELVLDGSPGWYPEPNKKRLQPQLRYLKLSMDNLEDHQRDYLTHHLTGLEEFELELSRGRLDWQDIGYLQRIKRFRIETRMFRSQGGSILGLMGKLAEGWKVRIGLKRLDPIESVQIERKGLDWRANLSLVMVGETIPTGWLSQVKMKEVVIQNRSGISIGRLMKELKGVERVEVRGDDERVEVEGRKARLEGSDLEVLEGFDLVWLELNRCRVGSVIDLRGWLNLRCLTMDADLMLGRKKKTKMKNLYLKLVGPEVGEVWLLYLPDQDKKLTVFDSKPVIFPRSYHAIEIKFIHLKLLIFKRHGVEVDRFEWK